jgi:dimethylglycine dehydrogenase
MRMEKGFLHWKADLLTEFDPFETGLDRFVKLDKGDFVGKAALIQRQEEGPRKKLVTFKIDATHAPAYGGGSLMQGDEVVGTVTSGDWGHRTGLNLGYAFVEPDMATEDNVMQLDHLGDLVDATVIASSPYDPNYSRMRS